MTAVDNTAEARTTDSDPLTFRVDSKAEATGFTPTSGTILTGSQNDGKFTIGLDRAASPSTVSPQTVKLLQGDGTSPSYSVGCGNTACTSITVDRGSALAEGHWTLSLAGVKSADEGVTFSGSASYAVPYATSGSTGTASTSSLLCGTTPTMSSVSGTYAVSPAAAGQAAFLDFDLTYSGPGGWTMQALQDTTPISGGSISGSTGGHYRLTFPSAAGGNLQFRLTVGCSASGNTSAAASNLFGSRIP